MTDREMRVFAAFDFCCAKCGAAVPQIVLTVQTDGQNEIAVCTRCLGGQYEAPSSKETDARVAYLLTVQEQIQAYLDHLRAGADTKDAELEYLSLYWTRLTGDQFELTPDGQRSLSNFLNNLPAHKIVEAMEIAFAKVERPESRFSYMCGILTNWIKSSSLSPDAVKVIRYWNYRRPQNWKKADEGKVEYLLQKYDLAKIKYYIDCVVEDHRGWADFGDVVDSLRADSYD